MYVFKCAYMCYEICVYLRMLSDLKRKFESEPEFEPRTSGFLARRSTT